MWLLNLENTSNFVDFRSALQTTLRRSLPQSYPTPPCSALPCVSFLPLSMALSHASVISEVHLRSSLLNQSAPLP